MKSIPIDQRISIKEFAYATGLAVSTVRNYIYQGKLQPIRLQGQRPFFTPDYLERVLEYGYEPTATLTTANKNTSPKRARL